jgi:antitoxin component YwqK of YwqJK toxin-antitoxin module
MRNNIFKMEYFGNIVSRFFFRNGKIKNSVFIKNKVRIRNCEFHQGIIRFSVFFKINKRQPLIIKRKITERRASAVQIKPKLASRSFISARNKTVKSFFKNGFVIIIQVRFRIFAQIIRIRKSSAAQKTA